MTRSGDDGRHILTGLVLLAQRDLDLAAAADTRLRLKRSTIRARLAELEARVAAGSLPVVGHHGDFWPGNVFVSDERIEVIDFEAFREGLELEDVAYFLVHLELQFSYPIVRRQLPEIRNSFLHGYGGDGRVDADALRLLTAAKALQVLARGPAAKRGSIRAAWVRNALRQMILRSVD